MTITHYSPTGKFLGDTKLINIFCVHQFNYSEEIQFHYFCEHFERDNEHLVAVFKLKLKQNATSNQIQE